MKFKDIIESASSGSTGAGNVATVVAPMGGTQSRNPSIYGGKQAGNLLTGKQSKGKYANSVEARKQMKLKEANVTKTEKIRQRHIKSGHNKKVKQFLHDEGMKVIEQWRDQLIAKFPKIAKSRIPLGKLSLMPDILSPRSLVKDVISDSNLKRVAKWWGKQGINSNGIDSMKARMFYRTEIEQASEEILLKLLPQIDIEKIKAVYKDPSILDTELTEDEVLEQEVLVHRGAKKKDRKTGFVPHGESRVDHEVKMAKSDLFATAQNAQDIMRYLKDRSEEEGIKGWMQSYITLANDYLNSVKESLQYETQMHEDQLAAYGNGADDRINTRNKLDKEPYGGPSSSSPGGVLQTTVGGS
jgi:hypothetical protein